MAVIKIKKKINPYVQIDKTGIEDDRLSWGATGLLTYLIGRPDNWEANLSHLSTVKKCGKDKTRTSLNELRDYNYVHYFTIKEKGKIIANTYLVFEKPTSIEVAQNEIELENAQTIVHIPSSSKKSRFVPRLEKPTTDTPTSEKATVIIKEDNNKRNNNTSSCVQKEEKKKRVRFSFLDKYDLKDSTKAILRKMSSLKKEEFEKSYKLFKNDINAKSEGALIAIVKGTWVVVEKEPENKETTSKEKIAIELNKLSIVELDKLKIDIAESIGLSYKEKESLTVKRELDRILINRYNKR